MPISKAGTSTESGFTLIELAVVIVLVGLLLGMVLPRLPGIGEDRLETTAQRIAGMTRHIYNEAALTGLEHRIRINLDEQRIEGLRLEPDGDLVPLGGNGRGCGSGSRWTGRQRSGRGRGVPRNGCHRSSPGSHIRGSLRQNSPG